MARFILYDSGRPSRTFRFPHREIIIGRNEEADLTLANVSVSRRHARVVLEDDGWMLFDLGSANGVQVNEVLVSRCRLSHGDRVQIGKFMMVFEEQEMDPLRQLSGDGSELMEYIAATNSPEGATFRVSPREMAQVIRAVRAREHGRLVKIGDPTSTWSLKELPLTFGSHGQVSLSGLRNRGVVAELTWEGQAHVVRRTSRWAIITVNQLTLRDERRLDDGDRLYFGEVGFRYEIPAAKKEGA